MVEHSFKLRVAETGESLSSRPASLYNETLSQKKKNKNKQIKGKKNPSTQEIYPAILELGGKSEQIAPRRRPSCSMQ